MSEHEALALHAQLRSKVGELAHAARSAGDVNQIAAQVSVLKRHQPRTYEVIGSAEADGTDFRELGICTDDGTFVGTEAPQLLCEAHAELTPWPCPSIAALAEELIGRPADRNVSSASLLRR